MPSNFNQETGMIETLQERYAREEAEMANIEADMATKHTPGPWNIHPNYLKDAVQEVPEKDGLPSFLFRDLPIAHGEKIIATATFWTAGEFGGWPRVDNEPEMLANARLIAAAPELLEVAQSILAEDMLQYLPAEYIAKVRAAIEKATGSKA